MFKERHWSVQKKCGTCFLCSIWGKGVCPLFVACDWEKRRTGFGCHPAMPDHMRVLVGKTLLSPLATIRIAMATSPLSGPWPLFNASVLRDVLLQSPQEVQDSAGWSPVLADWRVQHPNSHQSTLPHICGSAVRHFSQALSATSA